MKSGAMSFKGRSNKAPSFTEGAEAAGAGVNQDLTKRHGNTSLPCFNPISTTSAGKLTFAFERRNWKISRHTASGQRSEEHTSELQSRENLVCRLLLEK